MVNEFILEKVLEHIEKITYGSILLFFLLLALVVYPSISTYVKNLRSKAFSIRSIYDNDPRAYAKKMRTLILSKGIR